MDKNNIQLGNIPPVREYVQKTNNFLFRSRPGRQPQPPPGRGAQNGSTRPDAHRGPEASVPGADAPGARPPWLPVEQASREDECSAGERNGPGSATGTGTGGYGGTETATFANSNQGNETK